MVSLKFLDKSIERAQKYLASIQNPDGSWGLAHIANNEPMEYYGKVPLTSQGVEVFYFNITPENLEVLEKAIKFLLNEKSSKTDPLHWISYKLRALAVIETESARIESKKLIRFLKKLQDKNGKWKIFPDIDTAVSTFIIQGLAFNNELETVKKGTNFLLKNPAKDGKGWSLFAKGDTSFPTFTANVLECIVLSRKDINSPLFTKCRKFLEESQRPDGGWTQSKYTQGKESTPYGAGTCVLALMLASDDPFNKRVEKGIKFILKTQNRNGSWSVTRGGKPEIYQIYYSIRALALYKYLKQQNYLESVPAQYISINAFLKFMDVLKARAKQMFISRILTHRILGSTSQAIKRRLNILEIVNKNAGVTPATIIDILKKKPGYKYLNKRAYITQIQLDLRHLKDLKLIEQEGTEYLSLFSFF